MKKLKVGDKIIVKNFMNNYVVEVVRVTKTQAIAKTPYNYEIKFKLEYSDEPVKLPKEKWSQTTYTVLKNEGTN